MLCHTRKLALRVDVVSPAARTTDLYLLCVYRSFDRYVYCQYSIAQYSPPATHRTSRGRQHALDPALYAQTIGIRASVRHGRRSVGAGGGVRAPPLFSSVGTHRICPPHFFVLQKRKYHVCSSSSNLHSFVRLRNRHMLVEIASGTRPPTRPPPIYTHG